MPHISCELIGLRHHAGMMHRRCHVTVRLGRCVLEVRDFGPVFARRRESTTSMDPLDPLDAQQIVIEYARILERDIAENRHPARIDGLPFAKPIIKTAIRTSVTHLACSDQLTTELRGYFETAYTCLADYLDGELVELMTEYRRSAEQLSTEPVSTRDRTKTTAWRTLIEGGSLAGEVARAMASEADKLRSEFQGLMTSIQHHRSGNREFTS
jgi:hypothetical protein